MTEYKKIYKRFLKRIDDPLLPNFPEEDQEEILFELLEDAISLLDGQLEHSLAKNDIVKSFEENLSQFEIRIISMQMAIDWLEPFLNTPLLLNQVYGTKEEKFYSQANHLEAIQARSESMKTELSNLICSKGYSILYNEYNKKNRL